MLIGFGAPLNGRVTFWRPWTAHEPPPTLA
jgi:hypothetical protein